MAAFDEVNRQAREIVEQGLRDRPAWVLTTAVLTLLEECSDEQPPLRLAAYLKHIRMTEEGGLYVGLKDGRLFRIRVDEVK